MRGRRSVNWDEEIKKTKRIQKKGMCISLLSFVVALGVVGAAKIYNPGIAVARIIIPVFFMFIVLVAMVLVIRRRKK